MFNILMHLEKFIGYVLAYAALVVIILSGIKYLNS